MAPLSKRANDRDVSANGSAPMTPTRQNHGGAMPIAHATGKAAAEASECAADQGQFWGFHDALFADRSWTGSQTPQTFFLKVATKLKFKMGEFESCVSTHKHKARVDAGLQSGQRAGVNGTPSVFVNGYKLENPYDPALIEKMIAFARD